MGNDKKALKYAAKTIPEQGGYGTRFNVRRGNFHLEIALSRYKSCARK